MSLHEEETYIGHLEHGPTYTSPDKMPVSPLPRLTSRWNDSIEKNDGIPLLFVALAYITVLVVGFAMVERQ